MKKYSLYILFLMGLGAMAGSCTNLDEKIYDRLVDNNFYKNEKDIIAAITPVYTDYRGLLEWRKWWDFEETTDVAVTPRAAWFDGGIYIRLHKHTWKPEDPHFSDLWGQAYGGISNCNRVIYQLDNLDFEVTASADEVKTGSTIYMALQKTLHPSNVKTFNLQTWLDNGVCAVPTFIDTYEEGDKRLPKTWRMGQQYGSDGSILYCTGLVPGWEGKPLIYTKEVSNLENGGEAEGYRCGKYEIKMGTSRALDNDWVAMRYAEVYLMKAECILRTNGNAEEAAQLVNEVRKRAFDGDNKLSGADLLKTTNVNGVPVRFGILLDEWGREFALEGLRRSQLIRFDNNYTKGEWTFHEPSKETYLNLFPIPLSEIQANNKLEQNEGYK